MKCIKCQAPFSPTLFNNSVTIDICTKCQGAWFDQGEINFFVKKKEALSEYDRNGLRGIKQTTKECPRCHVKLNSGL